MVSVETWGMRWREGEERARETSSAFWKVGSAPKMYVFFFFLCWWEERGEGGEEEGLMVGGKEEGEGGGGVK